MAYLLIIRYRLECPRWKVSEITTIDKSSILWSTLHLSIGPILLGSTANNVDGSCAEDLRKCQTWLNMAYENWR